jgi:peroxiredoxin
MLVRGGIAACVVGALALVLTVWSSGSSSFPRAGSRAPTFSLPNLNGSGVVGTPEDGGGLGRPVVVLFMANWCSICQTEIPKLAKSIVALRSGSDPLARLSVIGVDSADPPASARSFIRSAGVTFPVGDDGASRVISSDYGFDGDPYAVFIRGDGTIMNIHVGALSPAQYISLGRALLSST